MFCLKKAILLITIISSGLISNASLSAANYAEKQDYTEQEIAIHQSQSFLSKNKYYILASIVAILAVTAANPDIIAKNITDLLVATGLNKNVIALFSQAQLNEIQRNLAANYAFRAGINFFNPCSPAFSLAHILEIYNQIPAKAHCSFFPTFFSHLATNGFFA